MDSNINPSLLQMVRNDLVQLHCENVSWEEATDKIPAEVASYLLGDLVQYLSTVVFLRGNRCLFTLEWPQVPDASEVWCYIVGLGLNCKFIDLLFKHLVIKFIEISFHLDFIVSEIIYNQTDTLLIEDLLMVKHTVVIASVAACLT